MSSIPKNIEQTMERLEELSKKEDLTKEESTEFGISTKRIADYSSVLVSGAAASAAGPVTKKQKVVKVPDFCDDDSVGKLIGALEHLKLLGRQGISSVPSPAVNANGFIAPLRLQHLHGTTIVEDGKVSVEEQLRCLFTWFGKNADTTKLSTLSLLANCENKNVLRFRLCCMQGIIHQDPYTRGKYITAVLLELTGMWNIGVAHWNCAPTFCMDRREVLAMLDNPSDTLITTEVMGTYFLRLLAMVKSQQRGVGLPGGGSKPQDAVVAVTQSIPLWRVVGQREFWEEFAPLLKTYNTVLGTAISIDLFREVLDLMIPIGGKKKRAGGFTLFVSVDGSKFSPMMKAFFMWLSSRQISNEAGSTINMTKKLPHLSVTDDHKALHEAVGGLWVNKFPWEKARFPFDKRKNWPQIDQLIAAHASGATLDASVDVELTPPDSWLQDPHQMKGCLILITGFDPLANHVFVQVGDTHKRSTPDLLPVIPVPDAKEHLTMLQKFYPGALDCYDDILPAIKALRSAYVSSPGNLSPEKLKEHIATLKGDASDQPNRTGTNPFPTEHPRWQEWEDWDPANDSE